jgi:hypothetical protein
MRIYTIIIIIIIIIITIIIIIITYCRGEIKELQKTAIFNIYYIYIIYYSVMVQIILKVKQSYYRPGVAQRVPGS